MMTTGNLAVRQLFRSRAIQAKLAISQPSDPDEQEADRIADRVMRMTEPEATEEEASQVQAKPRASPSPPLVRRMSISHLRQRRSLGK